MRRAIVYLFIITLVLLSNPPALAGHDTDQCPKSLAQSKIREKLFTHSPNQPWLSPRWALEASGADLMQTLPSVQNATAIDSNQIAVIDSGLLVSSNPSAGTQMQDSSPECDYDGHGTGVCGMIASEGFGVNPRLKIRSYPATLSFGGTQGALQEAIEDYQSNPENNRATIFNLSFAPSSEAVALVEQALKLGIWVVVASGNHGLSYSPSDWTIASLTKHSNFFLVGGLSYFLAPWSQSSYENGVRWYAPSTVVGTLNNQYHPNLPFFQQYAFESGTSYATPMISALLATLRSIYPELTVAGAKSLIDHTSIVRGKEHSMSQVNFYYAANLLGTAKGLLAKGECPSLPLCVQKAKKSFQMQIQTLKESLTEPEFSDSIDRWQRYYTQLRIGYFLSQGDRWFADKIFHLLSTLGLEENIATIYFSARGQEKAALVRTRVSPIELAEKKHALRFYSGKVPTQGLTISKTRDIDRYRAKGFSNRSLLRHLPASSENIPLVVYLIQDYLNTHSGWDWIEAYLSLNTRNNAFTLGLALALLEGPALPIPIDLLKHLERLCLYGYGKLFEALLEHSARHWRHYARFDYLKDFLCYLHRIAPRTRNQLIADYVRLRKQDKVKRLPDSSASLDLLEDQLCLWSPVGFTRAQQRVARNTLVENTGQDFADFAQIASQTMRAIHDWRQYITLQVFGNVIRFRQAFRRWVSKIDPNSELSTDPHYQVSAVLFAAANEPILARTMLEVLISRDHLARFAYGLQDTTLAQLTAFCESTPEHYHSRLLRKLTQLAQRHAPGEPTYLIEAFSHLDCLPNVKTFLDSLLRKERLNYGLSRVRLGYLRARINALYAKSGGGRIQSRVLSQHLEQYALLAKDSMEDLMELHPDIVSSEGSLFQVAKSLMHRFQTNDQIIDFLAWLAPAHPPTFAKYANVFTPETFLAFWKRAYSPAFDPKITSEFLFKYLRVLASQPNQTVQILEGLATQLEARSKATPEESVEMRLGHDRNLVVALQVIGSTRAGETFFRSHPTVLKALVEFIVEREIPLATAPIPPMLLEKLRAIAMEIQNVDEDKNLPRWYWECAAQDPELFSTSLRFYKSVVNDPLFIPMQERLTDSLLRLCIKHRNLFEALIAFARQHSPAILLRQLPRAGIRLKDIES